MTQVDEGPDPYRIGEIWDDVRKGEIECEPHLKEAVTGTLLNYGSEKVGTGYKWTKREPVSLLREIQSDLLKIADTGKTHEGEVLTDSEKDFYLQLRIRFMRITYKVRIFLQLEKEDEE